MKNLLAAFSFLVISLSLYSQIGTVQVTNVLQRTNGSGLVDIYFNLSGPGSSYNIAVEASFNAGSTYTAVPAGFLSGNVSGISPGSNKHIVWDGLGSFPNLFTTQAKIKLIANPSGGSGTWPPGTVHCSGTPTVIVDVTNPATGKTWMDRNLGASRAATSSTDAQAYGDLYQWGRFSDGHQCRNSAISYTVSNTDIPGHGNFILTPINPNDWPYDWRSPQNDNLWQGVSGINNPCPNVYRLPTDTELNAERLSWSSNDAVGAFNSPLRLPEAGIRSYGGNGIFGSYGTYWSATVAGTFSRFLKFESSNGSGGMASHYRAEGYSVRCIKETAPSQGTINTLNCSSATNNGTLTQGTSASGVNSVVPYTGGNSGSYNGQTVSSTGVTGLTATLASGSFANGDGTLTYTITGTPASSGTASFALNIGGQSCILIRAVNASGGGNGQPCPGMPTVTDIDGNTYNTVLIGNQCWMKENLKTTRGAAGNNITRYCSDNNTTNCDLYGGLYTWYTVMNGSGSSFNNPSGVQGICPTGWHVPSEAEWTQLVDYVISQGYPNNNWNDPNGAGNALKSCRQNNLPLGGDCNTTVHPRWDSDGTHHGFDEFGFAALPGGGRSTDGSSILGFYGSWWSSTDHSPGHPFHLLMGNNVGNVAGGTNEKGVGFSVRCLRD